MSKRVTFAGHRFELDKELMDEIHVKLWNNEIRTMKQLQDEYRHVPSHELKFYMYTAADRKVPA